MRRTAERYLENSQKPARSIKADVRSLLRLIIDFRTVLLYGAVSITMYTALYLFSNDLVVLAQETGHGHKLLFFVPIVLALAFSIVHGSFTAHFWEVLGVKAKQS